MKPTTSETAPTEPHHLLDFLKTSIRGKTDVKAVEALNTEEEWPKEAEEAPKIITKHVTVHHPPHARVSRPLVVHEYYDPDVEPVDDLGKTIKGIREKH